MRFFSCFFFSFIFIYHAEAQTVGMSYLCASKKDFPCDSALNYYSGRGSSDSALAFLPDVFGRSWGCISKYSTIAGHKTLIIYLSNEVARRNGRLSDTGHLRGWSVDEYNRALRKKNGRVRRKTKRRIIKLKRKTNALGIERNILSLGLEDNFTQRAANRLLEISRRAWPYEIARNPANIAPSSKCRECDLIEYHGLKPRGGCSENKILGLDGIDIRFRHRRETVRPYLESRKLSRWLKKNRACGILLLWSALHQGLSGSAATAAPTRERRCRVPREDIKELKRERNEFFDDRTKISN